jgi:hypothetical protein
LDDRAGCETVDFVCHQGERSTIADAEHVVRGDDLSEERCGRARKLVTHLWRRLGWRVDDNRTTQPHELLSQSMRQQRIQPRGHLYLDANDSSRSRIIKDAGHLEPAHPELVSDLALGSAVDEEPARHAGGSDELVGAKTSAFPARLRCHISASQVTNGQQVWHSTLTPKVSCGRL